MQTQYDLIVVGTGFASTFFLKQYLEKVSKNKRVLVLERGHLYRHRDRVKDLRGEHSGFSELNPSSTSTFINKSDHKHWPFTIGFGGSSNCWYGCTPRFMPSDFKMKSLYGVAEDWPVAYETLDPYYSAVEEAMNISGPELTPFPKGRPYPLPPHRFSTVDRILHKEYNHLYISQATARASQAVGKRNACCSSAVCSVCPVDAKFTIENSGFNVYQDERVELIMGAHVTHLNLQNNIVRSVVYQKDNRDFVAEAEVVALGANAIFNANILLNSNDRHPLTGRGLGEQFGLDVIVHLNNFENVGGSTWVTANGYMLYDGEHRKSAAACLIESNNAPYVRIEKGKWRHIAMFRLIFEDLPQDNNFIGKGEDLTKPEAHYSRPSDYTLAGMARAQAMLPKVLAPLPVEEIKYLDPFKTEAHIMGTTRMSSDPEKGVVDGNLIHHQYRNLFVLGSGSFTTFSPSNPTLTLSAMSLYAADKSF